MKRIPFPLLTALALCLMTMPSCKTPELLAYRTLGTTVVLVDAAMNGWGDYVRAGLATPDDQIRVRAAYEKYQAAMKVAKSVALAMKDSGAVNDPVWMQVVNAVTSSANDLINLIAQFVPSIKPITTTSFFWPASKLEAEADEMRAIPIRAEIHARYLQSKISNP